MLSEYYNCSILSYQNIVNHPKRISNLKSFINQPYWKETNFPTQPSIGCKKSELNNKAIALNVLYALYNPEE